jgi:hypothetical protein
MKKFRIPRKIKKEVKKGGIYLYPMDDNTKTYLTAWPTDNQEDYDAYKAGILEDMLGRFKRLRKK